MKTVGGLGKMAFAKYAWCERNVEEICLTLFCSIIARFYSDSPFFFFYLGRVVLVDYSGK